MSGTTGLFFNKMNRSWVSFWKDDGNSCSKSFSLKKYGNAKACTMALNIARGLSGCCPTMKRLSALMTNKVLYFLFCPIELVVNTQLTVGVKL